MDVKFDEVFEHVMMNAVIAGCAGDGVLDGLVVSENGAGASMHVDVSTGNCIVGGTKYTEVAITENLVIAAAHATLARKDIIIYDTSASIPAVITGTAATTPQPPDIPAGDILLAIVDVAATVTQILNADITDGIVIVIESTPSGVIAMWHGLIANIPTGWGLCNGVDGTPDLRSKFVRGAPNATEAGGTGGADTHTLSVDEIPSHIHQYSVGASDGTDAFSRLATTSAGTLGTAAAGGSAAHNNMPAYYEIAYIMKL